MKKIVVLTGAGISAESGLGTFRGSGGLWDKFPIEQVATPEGWAANPNLVTDFYNARRMQLESVEPNQAHRLLASLESFYEVVVVTQNVDNLHERAGSGNVIHLHGELTKVTSSREPDNPKFIRTLSPSEYSVPHGAKASDGSLLRPYIVWFGEPVPLMELAAAHAREADILVVVGTSLAVYPAAGLVNYAPHTSQIFVIDPNPVSLSGSPRVRFLETTATEGMRQLYDELSNGNQQ